MTSRNRFPKPPCPPKVDSEIMLGETPKRMQQTMDVTRDTPAPARPDMQFLQTIYETLKEQIPETTDTASSG